MDPCLSKILEGRQKLPKDKELEIIQAKVRDVMNGTFRSLVVSNRRSKKGNETKEVSIEDILHLVEKTVHLLGQANSKVVYYRRLNILNASLRVGCTWKGSF